MKKNYEYQRGAILVESAIVVGAIFLMLFGTVFLSIIGFDQMSADGASYEVAHVTSVGASAAPNAAAHGVYNSIPQGNISTTTQNAPTSNIRVDYGYNAASGSAEQQASVNTRHGGVAMVQGTMVVGTANKSSANILGMPISVVGTMIEPMWLENGVHFNAENADNYGSTTPVCAPTPNPQTNPPTPARCFQGSIFSAGENTPPYFVGFNLMSHCTRNIPWDSSLNPSEGTTCDSGGGNNIMYTPLGVAEFLDFNNWCDSSAPASTCTTVPAAPGLSGSKPTDSTFATIACHQRLYAKLATFFQNNQNLQQIYINQGGLTTAGGGPGIYYLNRSLPGGVGASNSFKVWEGYDTPVSQEDAYGGSGTPAPVDAAVRQIYSFDGHDVSGVSGSSTPLAPGQGC